MAGLKIADFIKEGNFSEAEEKERAENLAPADGK